MKKTHNTKKRAKHTKQSKHKIRKSRKHKQRGGGVREEQDVKNNFVKMVLNAYDGLISATNATPKDKKYNVNLDNAITAFQNGFLSNRNAINTLIPVNNTREPVLKINSLTPDNPKTKVVMFLPLLAVLFTKIDDVDALKRITNLYLLNSGNINLKSSIRDVTVLSTAIKLQNKHLVRFIIGLGGDVNQLTEEQMNNFNRLMREEPQKDVTNIDDIVLEDASPIVKLDVSNPLPDANGYPLDVEPAFWSPIFGPGKLMQLRERITDMMLTDASIPVVDGASEKLWSVCDIIKRIIPTYYVDTVNKPYFVYNSLVADQSTDFTNYNIVLCTALLVVGLITNKMVGQDYNVILKGGKSIQLVLSDMLDSSPYESQDIDVIIMPKMGIAYEKEKIQQMAGHLAYIVKWFLHNEKSPFKISVQSPNPENQRANQNIFKLSYVKTVQKYDYRQRQMMDDYKQFSDIGFEQLPANIESLFKKTNEYPFMIPELGENIHILFKCPNIGSLIDEKMYYYGKYMRFRQLIEQKQPIGEPGYQQLTIDESVRILDKFARAIVALTDALTTKRNPELDPLARMEAKKQSIMKRLVKMGFTENTLNERIVSSLYP